MASLFLLQISLFLIPLKEPPYYNFTKSEQITLIIFVLHCFFCYFCPTMFNKHTHTMINKKEIFNHIAGISAKSNYGGSFAGHITHDADMMATAKHHEVLAAIDNKESLAVKIMNGTSQTYTDKQLWVVTFEV